jgi:molybdopterin synthase sulfur carrier subunit
MPILRLELPLHLRQLANIPGHELHLDVPAPITLRSVLDTLESRYPQLRGTIRDHTTLARRPFLRFFVCNEDWSHQPTDLQLPAAILSAAEPLIILGAIAGG